jgi:hypothetical protein
MFIPTPITANTEAPFSPYYRVSIAQNDVKNRKAKSPFIRAAGTAEVYKYLIIITLPAAKGIFGV